jgi:RNA polymerase sigma-70 factor (ECF subfamily)
MLAEDISILSLKVSEQDDERAFEQIFLHFYPRLFSFALAYLKNRDWATEVVEDALIYIWENRKVLPAVKNLTYYLYVATRNGALNCLKKNRREATLHLDEAQPDAMQFHRDPENILISEEILQSIEKAISALPAKCQLIFRLVKEEGLKYREVAELLGISVKTVEAQMSIALRRIQEALPQHLSGQYRQGAQPR